MQRKDLSITFTSNLPINTRCLLLSTAFLSVSPRLILGSISEKSKLENSYFSNASRRSFLTFRWFVHRWLLLARFRAAPLLRDWFADFRTTGATDTLDDASHVPCLHAEAACRGTLKAKRNDVIFAKKIPSNAILLPTLYR